MTWRKYKSRIDLADSKIVKDDFILAQGSTLSFTFLDSKEKQNPFKRSLWVPVFYIFKIHKNHPMRLLLSERGFFDIWPLSDLNSSKKNFRTHIEVYRDKLNYDLSAFVMVPYDLDIKEYSRWKKYELERGFVSIDNKKSKASLLYANRFDWGLHSQDSLIFSQVMPSQVLAHLGNWVYEGSKVVSHDKTFNQRLEGMVSCSPELRDKIFPEIRINLEKRYKTHLSFKRN